MSPKRNAISLDVECKTIQKKINEGHPSDLSLNQILANVVHWFKVQLDSNFSHKI